MGQGGSEMPETGESRNTLPEAALIARRIDHLFRSAGPEGQEPPTYRQVSEGILQRTGARIGVTTLHALRTGTAPDPRISTIRAIAAYFGVPLDYFTDDQTAAEVDAQLQLLRTMRNAQVQQIALRADGLSPSSLELLQSLIEQARSAEGLDRPRRRTYRRRSVAEDDDHLPPPSQ